MTVVYVYVSYVLPCSKVTYNKRENSTFLTWPRSLIRAQARIDARYGVHVQQNRCRVPIMFIRQRE